MITTCMGKQGPTRHWPMAHPILINSVCVIIQSWDCHETVMIQSLDSRETVMRQSWDSHETVMRQSWDSLLLYSSCRLCRHVRSCLFSEMISQWVTLQQGGHMAMAFSLRRRPWQKPCANAKLLILALTYDFNLILLCKTNIYHKPFFLIGLKT